MAEHFPVVFNTDMALDCDHIVHCHGHVDHATRNFVTYQTHTVQSITIESIEIVVSVLQLKLFTLFFC